MCAPADCFVVFDKAVQVDPHGITPFLPYIIRSDLARILSGGNDDFVSLSNPLAD
jgi:hypothetical protein